MIIGWSASGKTNTFLNLINEQDDIETSYLYVKELSESQYELLIKNPKKVAIKYLNDLSAFIECSNTIITLVEK